MVAKILFLVLLGTALVLANPIADGDNPVPQGDNHDSGVGDVGTHGDVGSGIENTDKKPIESESTIGKIKNLYEKGEKLYENGEKLIEKGTTTWEKIKKPFKKGLATVKELFPTFKDCWKKVKNGLIEIGKEGKEIVNQIKTVFGIKDKKPENDKKPEKIVEANEKKSE